jgi:hypothetical protein
MIFKQLFEREANPKKIHFAEPANEQCAICPENILAYFRSSCERSDEA